MKKLLEKLVRFFKELFDFGDDSNTGYTPNPPANDDPVVEVVAETPKPNKPVEEVDFSRSDVPDSELDPKNAKVQSFLWKPEADGDGNCVVLIGCDKMNNIEISVHGKSGRKLKVGIRNTGRANRLGHMKYGRIHYRLDRPGSQFEKNAPITVKVFHNEFGIKTIMKEFKIKDPSQRVDIK